MRITFPNASQLHVPSPTFHKKILILILIITAPLYIAFLVFVYTKSNVIYQFMNSIFVTVSTGGADKVFTTPLTGTVIQKSDSTLKLIFDLSQLSTLSSRFKSGDHTVTHIDVATSPTTRISWAPTALDAMKKKSVSYADIVPGTKILFTGVMHADKKQPTRNPTFTATEILLP